ncbi:MAG: creatininase family protein [Planctomycetaceae bacterium]|nr:creatininase family protein [Planctomycetaceae bacterium]
MPSQMRPWILAETNYSFVKDCEYEVAVLPMGATEPHNLHLPYGTDTFEAEAIGSRACEAAWQQGAKVVLLPTIPYGTETNQSEFRLSMNLNPSTLGLVIQDLVESLGGHGIRKLLILNSHGGNEFKPLLRELHGTTDVQLFLCDWFRGLTADVRHTIFKEMDDHAGEIETSLAMAFFGHLVNVNADGTLIADDGKTALTRLDAVNQGWVSITRPWHLLTTNTGAGNPHAATPEKGERLMQIMVERLSQFLVDVAKSELDVRFPF